MNEKMNLAVLMPKGEVLDSFISSETFEILEKNFNIKYNDLGRNFEPCEVRDFILDSDIVVTGWGVPSLGNSLTDGTRVKLIAHTGGSVAELVDGSVYRNGIKVISGNEMYAESVAEGTVAYMLSVLRQIPDDIFAMKKGCPRGVENLHTRGLLGKHVGIVGFGMISRYVMQFLSAFHIKMSVSSSHKIDENFLSSVGACQVSQDFIFKNCDVVSLHSALTEKSFHTIGKEDFESMKDGAVFINTSRGAIIKEDEMIEVLKKKNISAVLDVFEVEPLSLSSELRSLPNVYPLPHRAGPTYDRRDYIGRKLVDDILAFARGEKLNFEISEDYSKRMTRKVQ